MKPVAAAVCLVVMACGVQAQPIYRCGTEYSRTPCPGGKLLESSDPRSAAQRAEAVRVAAQDRKKAAELERERRAQESGVRPARAAGFNGRPQPTEAAASGVERGRVKKSPKAKAAKTADFVAVEPGTPKKRGSK
jgi:hypothetical protein